jgi:addiction module HigA family antidote
MKKATKKPTHPGAFLRIVVLPAVNLTQQEISKRIDVSRNTLSGILNERLRLTPEVAARLGRLVYPYEPMFHLLQQIPEFEHVLYFVYQQIITKYFP